MQELSGFRLVLLRATYLLIAAGLALFIWPRLLTHSYEAARLHGDTWALLGGVSVLAVLGLRHPVRMLPLLLFEFVWKSIWLAAIALPLARAGQMDAGTRESVFACGAGVALMLIAIPWRHVGRHFLTGPGERRRPAAPGEADGAAPRRWA